MSQGPTKPEGAAVTGVQAEESDSHLFFQEVVARSKGESPGPLARNTHEVSRPKNHCQKKEKVFSPRNLTIHKGVPQDHSVKSRLREWTGKRLSLHGDLNEMSEQKTTLTAMQRAPL